MVFSSFNAHHLRGLLRLSHAYRPPVAWYSYLGTNLKAPWWTIRNFSVNAVAHQSSSSASEREFENLHSAVPFPATRIPQVRAFGFRELGIDEETAKCLGKVFPDVQRPTLTQTEYIPAILKGKDVMVHDETGTGKSFGIVLSLLSKVRLETSAHLNSKHTKPKYMALVVVPHRDLGVQMMRWIASVTNAFGKNDTPLDELAQLVVRGDSIPLNDKVEQIISSLPSILIGTPQALWELYGLDKKSLHVNRLSTVVVDETDYLLDVPPPYLRRAHRATAWRKFNKHPSLTRQLLDEIIPLRKPGALRLGEEVDEPEEHDRMPSKMHRSTKGSESFQIVMASATIHGGLREHLQRARWLDDETVYISGKVANKKHAHMALQTSEEAPKVIHHAFVVDRDGKISNVEFASKPEEKETKDENEGSSALDDAEKSQPPYEGRLFDEKVLTPQSPFGPLMLEAVATFFAFDVPNLALLVLPRNASVAEVVFELQNLGVNALNFDMRSSEIAALASRKTTPAQEPTLLVATPSATRGVDLPLLTHVFILGTPDVANVDVFKHIAGRVDRFGRGGKVVTFLTELEKEYRDGMMKTKKNPAGLLKTFYRKLGIKPNWFDLSKFEL